MLADELPLIANLIRSQRQAALGTLADGAPFVSMVAYAAEPGLTGLLLHLSGLSPHTKQLRADPRSSLLICEPDGPAVDDVQTLARISLVGQVVLVPHEAADYQTARACYLQRLPAAEMLFDFPDFQLFRFVPHEARYVGGFARAYTLSAAQLANADSAT